MIDSINIAEKDELVFEFDKFEFVFNNNCFYVLSVDGYFILSSCEDFKTKDNLFYLINDEEDTIEFTKEEYDMICSLIEKCINDEF